MLYTQEFKDTFEKSCCFTGYRPNKFPFELKRGGKGYTDFENSLTDIIFSLADGECSTFYSGMAMGFDIIAAETVLLLKKRKKSVRLICVLPFYDQKNGFYEPWRGRYNYIAANADEVIILSESYYPGCYARRNSYMVDNSDYVVTWFDGKNGGTKNTLRYAAKKGRCIINLNGGFDECSGIQTGFSL